MTNAKNTGITNKLRAWSNMGQELIAQKFASHDHSALEFALITGYGVKPIVMGGEGFYVEFIPRANSGDKKFYAQIIVERDGEQKFYAAYRQDYIDAQNSDHCAAHDTVKFAQQLLDNGKNLSKGMLKQLWTIATIVGVSNQDKLRDTYEDLHATKDSELWGQFVDNIISKQENLVNLSGQQALRLTMHDARMARIKASKRDNDAPKRTQAPKGSGNPTQPQA